MGNQFYRCILHHQNTPGTSQTHCSVFRNIYSHFNQAVDCPHLDFCNNAAKQLGGHRRQHNFVCVQESYENVQDAISFNTPVSQVRTCLTFHTKRQKRALAWCATHCCHHVLKLQWTIPAGTAATAFDAGASKGKSRFQLRAKKHHI